MTTSFSFAFHLAYRENICDETLFSTWDVFPLDRNNLQIPFFSLYAQITVAEIEQEIYKYVGLLMSRRSLCLSELGRPGCGWGHPYMLLSRILFGTKSTLSRPLNPVVIQRPMRQSMCVFN